MHEMSLPDIGDSRNNLSGYTQTSDDVVQSDLVGHRTEERCECLGVEENPWSGQLSNGLVVVA